MKRRPVAELAKVLEHSFADPDLLHQALTHRSMKANHNERLEFLGDSILNFVIAAEIYQRYPNAAEGDLSRIRASLVNKHTLAKLGQQLQLADYLMLGAGELKSGGMHRKSIIADAVEAIIGAVYLDADFAASAALILRLYSELLEKAMDVSLLKDPKTRLQEYLQSRRQALPVYELVDTQGKPHAQTFKVLCRIEGVEEGSYGIGSSRREAEQQAAYNALESLSG